MGNFLQHHQKLVADVISRLYKVFTGARVLVQVLEISDKARLWELRQAAATKLSTWVDSICILVSLPSAGANPTCAHRYTYKQTHIPVWMHAYTHRHTYTHIYTSKTNAVYSARSSSRLRARLRASRTGILRLQNESPSLLTTLSWKTFWARSAPHSCHARPGLEWSRGRVLHDGWSVVSLLLAWFVLHTPLFAEFVRRWALGCLLIGDAV